MTIATVQLIMGGLGLVTCLLIALLGPGSRWLRWPLALCAGVGVAATGWSQFWPNPMNPDQQLVQSLLLASVIVLLALLTVMLLFPSRRGRAAAIPVQPALAEESTDQVLEELSHPQEPGRDAIRINLDQNPDAMIAHQDEHALMHLLASGKAPVAPEDELLLEVPDIKDVELGDVEERHDDAPTPAADVDPNPSADVVSLAERREQREESAAADALDLSDSDELYQAMRDAEAELELPDDPSWLNETDEAEIDPRDHDDDALDEAVRRALESDIEDAEILAIDEAADVDADATTADLPVTQDYEESDVLDANDEIDAAVNADVDEADAATLANAAYDIDGQTTVPATLDDALNAQRRSIEQLSADTDTLAERLTEWRDMADQNEQHAWTTSLVQGHTVEQQHERIVAENNFRQAAVELIHTQRDVMQQLMRQLRTLGAQREEDLATLAALQENALNQRRLARQAALLARKAAANTQSLRGRLGEEKLKHERTQGAAQRAMGIARDAVDKLAEHERRLGLSGDHVNPDTKN